MKCRGCNGPFVARDYPFCWRCAAKRAAAADARQAQRWQQDRTSACAWAAAMLAADCLILDTETTGLEGYIVEIAAIDRHGNVLLNERLNPLAPIEDAAAEIHGITLPLVVDAPVFAALTQRLHKLLYQRTVCVYNMPFDRSVLLRERARLGEWPGEHVLYGARWEDVMLPYAAFIGEPGRSTGEYRWQRLPGGDHSALGDCQATLTILQKMARAVFADGDC